jgi:hypothetical protein
MSNHHAHAPDVVDDTVQHEESDVNIRAIFGFGIGLFVVAVVVHVAVYLLFVFLTNRQEAANSIRQYPLAAGQENRLPPEPRLQTTPRQDLQDLRAREDQLLNGYSWVDRNTGVVRIPIDEAIKLTIQRGLPSRNAQQTGQPQATGQPAAAAPARRSAPAQPTGQPQANRPPASSRRTPAQPQGGRR